MWELIRRQMHRTLTSSYDTFDSVALRSACVLCVFCVCVCVLGVCVCVCVCVCVRRDSVLRMRRCCPHAQWLLLARMACCADTRFQHQPPSLPRICCAR